MAKQVLEIKDFSGGLNCSSDARDIQFNEFSQLWNISPSQTGILKIGGSLVQYIDNIPHNSANYQEGYGLFATSIDSTPSILDSEFETGFEEGTVASYTATQIVITLATLPSFQSVVDHNTDNFYRNMTILIYSGNGIGQCRRIVGYAGDTKIATITDAFSSSSPHSAVPNSSSKYKIFRIAGDNTKFGNANELDYIDKGGSDFPYDDTESHDTDYENSYFLRTQSGTISDGASLDLGFVMYNPKSHLWAAGDALSTDDTNKGNNVLKSGIRYTLSFWCKAKYRYYGYVSDNDNSANQRGERVPFVQIYSDSVTDGTNTGLYLFQSSNGLTFQSGSDSTYNYADNLTNEHVKNGDFEDGAATDGDGGYNNTYDPPENWMAYDGFAHNTNNTITYTFETGSNAYGSEGNTLNMNPGSAFALDQNNVGGIPNCYLYQDLTLEDNQWYELSYIYSTSTAAPLLSSIVDTFNLTSTGIVSNEGTLAATDGDAVLTVDGTTATDALVKNREIYTSTGVFLGVCTTVNSGTEIRFAAGTAAAIDNDTTLYVANYINKWEDNLMVPTGGITTYFHGGAEGKANRRIPLRFFVPDNSGTPRVIRIAFAPFNASQDIRLDGVSVKKSLPDLVSISNNTKLGTYAQGNPYSSEVQSWNKYEITFKIPGEYDNATDWVINLNAGSFGFQNGADNSYNNQAVYFDTLRIETSDLGGNLIFLNDNTATESKINIYSEEDNKWQENTGLTWSGLNMQPVYNYINGMLKISDANFESGNTSKLFYYHNFKHLVRENPLSLPPSLEVSANANPMETNSQYQSVNYINEHSYLNGHQWYGVTPTETNWDLDKIDKNNGRVIWYWSVGNYGTDTDLETQENVLKDAGGTELTQVHYSESKTNPMYFTWCGQHGGSGNDIDNDDMHTQISSVSTGSISQIKFEFTYEFQGGGQATSGLFQSSNFLINMNPPIFHITAGKRASTATDVFGSGSIVTDDHKKQLSIGTTTFVAMENSKKAIIYTDSNYTDLYDIESERTEGKNWNESTMWPISTVTNGDIDGNKAKTSEKTFYGTIAFEDGDIEITDDIIFEVRIEYPENNLGYTLQNALARNYNISSSSGSFYDWNFPRWEKIKFSSILTSFRSTSWTALTDGFSSSNATKTKTNFTFGTPSGATAFGWGERMFSTGVSSVNIFDEESNIEVNSEIIGSTFSNNVETSASNIGAGQCPDVSVYVGMDVFNDDYRKKLKYYMKDTTSDIWYLQFYIDLEKNIIYSTTSNFKAVGIRSDINRCYQYFIPKENILNYNEVDSYESQTLISQDLKASELICDYKTSVVANSRMYVGNVKQDGIHYPDRILKSPIGKYNILPKSNFIDVAINDGDEITALEYYKDKLLQFKKRKVFVINTSGDYEFLEDTFDNVGVQAPYQVCKTPYGIVWANQSGVHVYDGNQIFNLIDGKLPNNEKDALISENYWSIEDKSLNSFPRVPLVGYNPKEKEIIIKAGIKGKTSGSALTKPDGYVYSFKSKSWYMTHKTFQGISKNTFNAALSNFVNNSEGELISYVYQISDTHNVNNILKWQTSEGNDESISTQKGLTGDSKNPRLIYITTADFAFNNIAARKKVYKIYITYKSTNSSNSSVDSEILIKYAVNGTGTFSGTFKDSSTNYASTTGLTGSTSWTTAILKPSASINNIYSIQLQFTKLNPIITDFAATGFQINDISIIYREKPVK